MTHTNNPTDTNQASEDELKTKASDSSSEASNSIIPELYEYCLGVGLELSNYQAIELTKLIQKLIRTEKLKLLAEVRERVQVNQKGQFEEDSTGNVCWYLDDLVEALKEMEAEL